MVERVLLFARIGSGFRTPVMADVDLSRVIADAVNGVAADADDRGVTVGVHLADGMPTIAGDADALRSAIQNVVGNGVKYSVRGGVVHVIADVVGAATVRVRVVDRGLGIDAEDLAQVFQPFFRGRRAIEAQVRGTGVGLSVVQHVIRGHGGDVTIESRVGAGSTVTIVLPAGSADEVAGVRRKVIRLKEADARS